jgi:tetratricopeptide (TPR) repeat protein
MEHVLGIESDTATALDPEARRDGLHTGLVSLLTSLQGLRILWVDDLQWIDSAGVEVLKSWIGRREPGRLRVVTTLRIYPGTEEGEPAMEAPDLGRAGQRLELSGLSDSASKALLEQRGTPRLIPRGDVDSIIERCRGNPFFLDQCARFVEDELAAGNTPVIPGGVHEVIRARIDRLSSGVRDAVETAAVLGLRFDMRILSAMLREEKLPDALQSAQREGFWQATNELNFIFCHALIRDAVYDAQLAERRLALHAAAVRAFEQVYTGDARRAHLYQLAEHCERAGRRDEAVAYLAEAAQYAFEQYENDRAVTLLRRRRALTGSSDLRAVADLAEALIRTAAWDEASQLLEGSVRGGVPDGSAGNLHAFADCCHVCANLLVERGETTRSRHVVAIGLEALDGVDYNYGRAFLHGTLGLAHFREGEHEQSSAEYETALAYARASDDRRAAARLMNDLAVVHVKTGKHREALSTFESTLDVARELRDIRGVSSALNNIGYLYNEMGHFEQAMPYFQEDLSLCVDAGLRQGQAIAAGNVASVLSSLGRHEEAISYFIDAIDIDTRIGFLPHKAYNLQQLGSSLISRGDAAEGCGRLREALELAGEINFPMVRDRATDLLEGCTDVAEMS